MFILFYLFIATLCIGILLAFFYFIIYSIYILFFLPTKYEFHFYNFIGNWVKRFFPNLAKFFPVHFVNKAKLDVDGEKYLYVFIPHGLVTVSQVVHTLDPHSPLKELRMHNAAHSFFFHIPIIRELVQLAGFFPVSRDHIDAFLQDSSISITVGGVREIAYALDASKDDKLFIKKRRGFIRAALDNSVDIVLIYCWNEQQLVTYEPSYFIEGVNELVGKLLGRSVNLNVLQFLRPSKLRRLCDAVVGRIVGTKLYVGEPVRISGMGVDEAHALYIKEVKRLFAFVAEAEGSDKELVIE